MWLESFLVQLVWLGALKEARNYRRLLGNKLKYPAWKEIYELEKELGYPPAPVGL